MHLSEAYPKNTTKDASITAIIYIALPQRIEQEEKFFPFPLIDVLSTMNYCCLLLFVLFFQLCLPGRTQLSFAQALNECDVCDVCEITLVFDYLVFDQLRSHTQDTSIQTVRLNATHTLDKYSKLAHTVCDLLAKGHFLIYGSLLHY